MRTYGEVFRVPEFTPLFVTWSAYLAGATVSGLALGVYVYAATGSPLLAALAMFGPSLAQIAGASFLLSAADRVPPRAVLTLTTLVTGLGTLVQAIPGLPLGAIFAITLAIGLMAPLAGGARFGLVHEILPEDGFLLGRSVLNMANGVIQVVGFAIGGALVTVLSPRGTLVAGAALYLAAAAGTRLCLRRRPPRVTGRPSVRETWRVNGLLWSSAPRRYVYLALWVPNGLVVGCEALFVSYSPRHAGLMYAFTALGMLAGDTLAGRFTSPALRQRLSPWLRLLLAVPYLSFAFAPAFPVAVAAASVASVGYSASLLLQERLMTLTPHELSGHALGLQGSGTQAMQGVGAALAGVAAQWTTPAGGIVIMALASVAVTLLLAPRLQPPARRPGDLPASQPRSAPGPLADGSL
jgi:predicted MFS family arabinose efflux permease